MKARAQVALPDVLLVPSACVSSVPNAENKKELTGRSFGQTFNVSTGSCAEVARERMGGEES